MKRKEVGTNAIYGCIFNMNTLINRNLKIRSQFWLGEKCGKAKRHTAVQGRDKETKNPPAISGGSALMTIGSSNVSEIKRNRIQTI